MTRVEDHKMPRLPRRLRARRGSYTVPFVLASTVLLGVVGLAVDTMQHSVVMAELQNAVDAASHMGAGQLDGTEDGMAAALLAAEDMLGENMADGEAVDPKDVLIEFGNHSPEGFTVSAEPEEVNAMRLTHGPHLVNGWYTEVLGVAGLPARAQSVAVSGGVSEVACPFPLAMPTCAFDLDLCNTDIVLQYSPDPVDNVGWAVPNNPASANNVRGQLETCESADTMNLSDTVNLSNGQSIAALRALRDLINLSDDEQLQLWDDEEWGSVPWPQASGSSIKSNIYGEYALVGQMPLFEDDSDCADPSFTGEDHTVAGFATIAIYDVEVPGNGQSDDASGLVKARLLCDVEVDAPSGGIFGGTVAHPLVIR